MQYRALGRSGLKVSSVSLGSWLTIGNVVEDATTESLVKAAFDAGVNLFDTADVYNRGAAETALGKVLPSLPRHHVVLASKCFFPMSDDVNDRGLSRKHVVESCEMSLRRLGTDYLDLYQCHRSDSDTPLEETCRAMDDLIRSGKVIYWGTSAWPAWRIARAVELCRAHGWHVPISNQPCYNLMERGIETEVLPACAELGVGQVVYSPLAQGVLTGKYRRGAAHPDGSRAADERVNRFIQRFMADGQLAATEALVELAAKHDTSATRLALSFCLSRPGVSSVIVGARSVEQLSENVSVADVEMDASLVSELERLFPHA